MKMNLPVTDIEHLMRDDQLIVSKTDLKGRITHFNRDFVDISGFTEEELLGASQNIIRHPDMPSAIFKDLWETIQAGRPWTGLVKNRCKNGDFYWVEANVSPLRAQGVITGYISVRRKPSREQIAEAEVVYARLRAGKAAQPLLTRLSSKIQDIRITRALPGGLGLIALLFTLALALSLMSLKTSTDQLERITQQTHVLEQAYSNMLLQGLQMTAALRYTLLEPTDKQARNNVVQANAQFDADLDLVRRLSAGDAQALATLDAIAAERRNQVSAQQRLLQRIDSGDLVGAKQIYDQEENASWRTYKILITTGTERAEQIAQVEQDAAIATVARAKGQAIGASIFALLAAIVLGIWLTRKISKPLRTTLGHLESIAEGDYSTRIQPEQQDELGEMMLAVKSVQARLDYDMQEARRIAQENLRIRVALDNVTLPVTLSDDRNRLIYLNAAAMELMHGMAGIIVLKHPGFDVNALLGRDLSEYFDDGAVRMAIRDNHSQEALDVDTQLGGRELRLTISSVLDDAQVYQGRITQWLDRTAEVGAEREIADIIAAASSGDFSRRVDTTGKDGFIGQLSEGLNRLMDIVASGLSSVADVLNAIASGDLERTIEADFEGTFGQVKDDTNTTVARLREVVGQIMEVSDAIGTAAGEISSGNTDLSGRTEEQAASLEETASSMEQLNATVKQNAQNADQANQLAQDANLVATRGGDMVQRLVVTMTGIQESSRRIADIISVIDGIAFQTNILALNAAVEAARAGEQGRGFAVVASEVRSLAQRSAQAAKEIKELIMDSVDKVEDGADIASQAGNTMVEIVTSFRQVAGLVSEITGASREQSSGIAQVTQAVAQMDEVTQQNAALVEQAAAAAESLEDQTRVLAQTISMFKLTSHHATRAPTRHEAHGSTALVSKKRSVVTKAPTKSDRAPSRRTVAAAPGLTDDADQWEEF